MSDRLRLWWRTPSRFWVAFAFWRGGQLGDHGGWWWVVVSVAAALVAVLAVGAFDSRNLGPKLAAPPTPPERSGRMANNLGEAHPELFELGPVLPDMTRRGRIHEAVEVNGVLSHSFEQASSYVRTRCGLPDLGPCSPHPRNVGFPDCRRCYPPTGEERDRG